jgi:predicted nuclease of predicted toxin-antitoxin system
MRFLVDQNLPAVLCDWLTAQGCEAEHIRLLGMRDAADLDIIRRAKQTDAIIISRDYDFALRAGGDNIANWFQLIWVRVGNTNNAELLGAFESAWPSVLAALERGDPLVQVD